MFTKHIYSTCNSWNLITHKSKQNHFEQGTKYKPTFVNKTVSDAFAVTCEIANQREKLKNHDELKIVILA